MLRKFLLLSILVIGGLFPMFAFAASPVDDDFNSGFSGWNNYASGFNTFTWDNNGADCYYLFCAKTGGGFNQQYENIKYGTALSSGAFVIYYRNDGYTGSMGFGVCTVADPTHCESPSSAGGTDAMLSNDTGLNNDNAWHYIYFAFEDGGSGVKQYCVLHDDNNPADCSWQANGWGTANGTTYSGVVMFLGNGMNSGATFYVDELGEAPFVPPAINTTTHIETVTPAASSTIATSSTATFGVTGYINPGDYTPGMTVQMKYAPYVASQEAVACVSCLFTTVSFNIATSGVFSFSTTSPATVSGLYTMQSNIQGGVELNFFNLFSVQVPFLSNPLAATSTTFLAGQYNGFDQYIQATTNGINSYFASSTISLASCSSFTSFNLGDCIGLLFLPQAQPMQALYQQFQAQFLSYFPWGYVTRFVSILSENGTSTLPSATATISLPYMNGNPNDTEALTIDPTGTLADASAALDSVDANGTSLNWQGVLEPFVQLFIAISLLFIIVHDLIGTVNHYRHSHKSGRGGSLS